MKAPPDTDFSQESKALQGGGDVSLDLVLPPLSFGVEWGLGRTEEALSAFDRILELSPGEAYMFQPGPLTANGSPLRA